MNDPTIEIHESNFLEMLSKVLSDLKKNGLNGRSKTFERLLKQTNIYVLMNATGYVNIVDYDKLNEVLDIILYCKPKIVACIFSGYAILETLLEIIALTRGHKMLWIRTDALIGTTRPKNINTAGPVHKLYARETIDKFKEKSDVVVFAAYPPLDSHNVGIKSNWAEAAARDKGHVVLIGENCGNNVGEPEDWEILDTDFRLFAISS